MFLFDISDMSRVGFYSIENIEGNCSARVGTGALIEFVHLAHMDMEVLLYSLEGHKLSP